MSSLLPSLRRLVSLLHCLDASHAPVCLVKLHGLELEGKDTMRAFLLGVVGVIFSLFPPSGAAEEPALSGAVLLSYCESALQERTPRSFEAGVCVGVLQTLAYIQPLLDPRYGKAGYCLPQDLPSEQEVRVVVTYLQSHPERLQEEGRTLALDALHQAFPCKK